ncbi:transglutaminase domain-containing protein [Paenibacillus protaetiae]|uniref:Transglutaminase domain-containing protein n=1 Tax=Paenibacillus protaetiae TaxID=2509456 RepID=A0A4P6EYP5_9BACL|nr:transglutaminase-like domain-containing protein [Paenibacillus protaetiae]QAY68204.1 transglutaminase domain-containing protein [Paenibacillus protaetiae]
MMDGLLAIRNFEPVSAVVLLLLIGSLVQGIGRGASGSARRLFLFVWEAAVILVCLAASGRIAGLVSPAAADWLSRNVAVPERELGWIEQLWYTLWTSVRDFPLLRYGVIFLISYLLLRLMASLLEPYAVSLMGKLIGGRKRPAAEKLPGQQAASRAVGAVIGAIHGAGRSFVFMALLFVYVSLLPGWPLAGQIGQSPLYKQTADLLEPVAGKALAGKGPVLAEAVQAEFKNILERKYEIVDYNIPSDIGEAAKQITKSSATDEEKARALYRWVGTRISYDWDKADNYVENGVWKEQTPEETFAARKGVCIDYARLYAMMARSVGLEVRVVTGMGADGRGGFGPHAWNEVKLNGRWVPLDATWASSGDWFDAPHFEQTHIRDV